MRRAAFNQTSRAALAAVFEPKLPNIDDKPQQAMCLRLVEAAVSSVKLEVKTELRLVS